MRCALWHQQGPRRNRILIRRRHRLRNLARQPSRCISPHKTQWGGNRGNVQPLSGDPQAPAQSHRLLAARRQPWLDRPSTLVCRLRAARGHRGCVGKRLTSMTKVALAATLGADSWTFCGASLRNPTSPRHRAGTLAIQGARARSRVGLGNLRVPEELRCRQASSGVVTTGIAPCRSSSGCHPCLKQRRLELRVAWLLTSLRAQNLHLVVATGRSQAVKAMTPRVWMARTRQATAAESREMMHAARDSEMP